ncbi:MAG: hypothetical protein J7M08_03165 [Planctomycetes bacterium]|nr:hypothetical protein [Planctomycetota bacterium]
MSISTWNLQQGTAKNLARDKRGRWRLQRTAHGYEQRGEFLCAAQDLGRDTQRVTVLPLAQWTAPLRWEKHEANPIYGPEKSGAWDTWTNGVSIVPCDGGKTYRMYYAGNEGEGIGFAEASVDDPLTWKEHPASPVLRPREGSWEGPRINQPRVVAVSAEHWRMYYSASWMMGVAESFDGGVTWERCGDEPLIERGGPDSPDGGGACVPMVLRVGERWMMWYTAVQLNPEGHQNIHLCLATSADGVHWEKHPDNPVLGDDFSDGAPRSVTSRCYVRHDGGVFRMWYSFAKPRYRILYAESLDGVEWERAPLAPVLGPSPAPAWDDEIVEYPEVQIHGGELRLWFCGNGYGSVGFARGVPETGVRLFARTGGPPAPDSSWTDWTQIESGQPLEARRFLQVRAELWSSNPELSPALNHIHVHAL